MSRNSPSSRPRAATRAVACLLAGPGLIAAALAVAGPAAASPGAAHNSSADVRFLQVSKASNRLSDSTFINNPATNDKPNVLLFVTPNWNPHNTTSGKYLNTPIGVFYDTTRRRWAIFREDGATMPLGRAFNVLVVPRTTSNAFTVKVTSTNVSGDSVIINSSLTNHHSNAILQVTQNYDPHGRGGFFNDHNVGVWYDGSQWLVFEEDSTSMPVGASFNVLIGTKGTGATAAVLKATHANTANDYTLFSSSRTNNNSSALIFATQNYNPGGGTGHFNNAPIGVGYDKVTNPHKWSVFNEDLSAMPIHAAFNLLIYKSS